MDTSDPDYLFFKRHELYLALQRRFAIANETVPEDVRSDHVLMGLRHADGTLTCGGCGHPIKAYEPYLFIPGEGAHHLDDCLNPVCVLCGGTILGSRYLVRTPDPEEWGVERDHVNHRICVEAYELIKALDLPDVCWPPSDEDDE